MIKQNTNLITTKEKIKSYYNKDLEVKVSLGRNKFATYKGKLTAVYPALFTVTPSIKFSGKTSFSYSEYMCGLVKLKEIT